MGANEQVRNSAHGSIIPVRKETVLLIVQSNELWYTIPYHLRNQIT